MGDLCLHVLVSGVIAGMLSLWMRGVMEVDKRDCRFKRQCPAYVLVALLVAVETCICILMQCNFAQNPYVDAKLCYYTFVGQFVLLMVLTVFFKICRFANPFRCVKCETSTLCAQNSKN